MTVYRLITIGTVEEKIMSLQNFKKKLEKQLISSKQTVGEKSNEEVKVNVDELISAFKDQTAFKEEEFKEADIEIEEEVDNDWMRL